MGSGFHVLTENTLTWGNVSSKINMICMTQFVFCCPRPVFGFLISSNCLLVEFSVKYETFYVFQSLRPSTTWKIQDCYGLQKRRQLSWSFCLWVRPIFSFLEVSKKVTILLSLLISICWQISIWASHKFLGNPQVLIRSLPQFLCRHFWFFLGISN